MKFVKLIYNPYSGDGRLIRNLDKIIEFFQQNNYTLVPFRISNQVNLEDAFTDYMNYEFFLLAGGDGTLNNIINVMKTLDIDKPVGLLPTGTANDFSTCLGMPKDILKACKQILNSNVKEIDLGKINDKYFINVASMGLFTDVSQKTNVNMKNTIGKLAYYLNSLYEIPKFKRLNITINSKELNFSDPSLIVFVFNGRTAGNLHISYKSQVDDGLLDVIIVKGDLGPNTILSFFEFARKEHLEKPKGVLYFKTDSLEILSKESIVTDIDGERGPEFPLQIRCLKGALKVLGTKL